LIVGLYRSRMNSWLPDTASAPSDTGGRRAGRRRGWRVDSGGALSTVRRRTRSRRPRSRHCRGLRACTGRTSCDRTEPKPPRSPGYCSDSSPRTSPIDSSPPLLQQSARDYKMLTNLVHLRRYTTATYGQQSMQLFIYVLTSHQINWIQ